MLPLALLLPLIGGGVGALTHLSDPKQMLKNMGIGAGIGSLGAFGASAIPGLTNAAATSVAGPTGVLGGLPELAGNPALTPSTIEGTGAAMGFTADSPALSSITEGSQFANSGQLTTPLSSMLSKAPGPHLTDYGAIGQTPPDALSGITKGLNAFNNFANSGNGGQNRTINNSGMNPQQPQFGDSGAPTQSTSALKLAALVQALQKRYGTNPMGVY